MDKNLTTLIENCGSIWAIGRNFENHAKEMNAEPPKSPLVFNKSPRGMIMTPEISLPTWSSRTDYELEIAVWLGENCLPQSVSLALDLTARDTQKTLKSKGAPWALSKNFKNSCPISKPIPYISESWFKELELKLEINGKLKQHGFTKDFIFNLKEILDYLKEYFPIAEGDLILTGTPEGVGPLSPGDQLIATIPGQMTHSWNIDIGQ